MKNMKKFIAALLVMTMVVALASTALAYVDETDDFNIQFKGTAWGFEKVTNNYGKNRSSVALRKGSVAHVVAVKGDWYKVEIPGRNGGDPEYLYFNSKYAKKTASDILLLYSSGGSGRSSVNGDVGTVKKGWKLRVKKGRRTNVRKTASLAGKSLGVVGKGHGYSLKMHKDRAVKQDDRNVLFFHIMYKGKAAWVSGVYLELYK